ncbi:MAG: hypothetical protein A3H25_08890 [Sphingomonadales bacterium RIFCSPLOWO2_12_FULL_63_15]|nr:MAG: hypothetical protein A3H25_08890 [Sphingomonadales bacterium RIFCSPLOWO2_12_FULL_63_15]
MYQIRYIFARRVFWKTDGDREAHDRPRLGHRPAALAGLLLAIDPILDIGRTAVNFAGQVLVGMAVAESKGILNEAAGVDSRDRKLKTFLLRLLLSCFR